MSAKIPATVEKHSRCYTGLKQARWKCLPSQLENQHPRVYHSDVCDGIHIELASFFIELCGAHLLTYVPADPLSIHL
ncbi:hypothetical protein D9613_009903 [Agrocybe pediades]|uniref:Uncharacterized protein n=1 Tax=Agrocybe pediades TaxID=84607 RepID=A0A8H4QXF5_9AGAR|nr:hypothetical protein D9613_009903 [Agrocybe pediades]